MILSIVKYGAGTVYLNDRQYQKIELIHIKALRDILSTRSTTISDAVLGETRMLPIQAIFERARLQLFGNLLSLDDKRLVRKLFLSSKLVKNDLNDILTKYSLRNSWKKFTKNKLSLSQWKELVNESIETAEIYRLKDSLRNTSKCPELSDLNLRMITHKKVHFQDDRKFLNYMSDLPSNVAKFIFKLKSGSLPLEIETQR